MEFFDKISENKLYKTIMKTPFSYTAGAILISIISIAYLATFGSVWEVTGSITVWGAKLFRFVGIDTTQWKYFMEHPGLKRSIMLPILKNGYSLRNIGIVVGAMLSVLYASEFRIKKIKNKKQLFLAIAGGLLMGIGARFSNGCNIGAFYSGMAVMSLSAWFFAGSLLLGAIIGCRILINILAKEKN